MTTNTEGAESLILQCKYNGVTLTRLTLPRGACISQGTDKIYILYFTNVELTITGSTSKTILNADLVIHHIINLP